MKGQNLRLAIKADGDQAKKYIAGALTFDLQIDADTEESSTKDSTGGWKEYEAGLKGFSGSGQCQLVPDADKLVNAYAGWDIANLIGQTVEASFDDTEGSMNRSQVRPRKKGNVIITSWKISAQNGQTINADFSFQGTGALADETPYISGADEVILLPTATAKTVQYVASDAAALTKTTDAEWLTLGGSGNNVIFTPTAYAHAASGADPRVAEVVITTTSGARKVVIVKQPMAAS